MSSAQDITLTAQEQDLITRLKSSVFQKWHISWKNS